MEQGLTDVLARHCDEVSNYYEALNQLAGQERVFHDSALNAWIVTGYHECVQLLSDKRLTRNRIAFPRNQGIDDLVEFVEEILNAQSMFSECEESKALRNSWSRILTKPESNSSINLSTIAAGCLDSVERGSEFDAYSQLLQPFVSRVVCLRLGINETDRQSFYPSIVQYARFLDGKVQRVDEFQRSLFAIASLYRSLASRPTGPARDFYSDRHKWTADYLLNIVAGHESTAYLLGTIFLNAGGESGYLSVARNDGHLLRRVVDEAARFDSPVQIIGRRAVNDLSLNGTRIKAGDRVFLHIGAANRDIEVFDRANRFDPERHRVATLTFGFGQSRCPGMSLAVEESVAFLSSLFARGQRLDINRNCVQSDHGLSGRGFRKLPARIQAL